jgi:hypothetical protein
MLAGWVKRYGPRSEAMAWNREFRRGQWAALNHTADDSLYPLLLRCLQGSLLDVGCGTGSTARDLPLGSHARCTRTVDRYRTYLTPTGSILIRVSDRTAHHALMDLLHPLSREQHDAGRVRIPAHCERSFRANLNTHSDGW